MPGRRTQFRAHQPLLADDFGKPPAGAPRCLDLAGECQWVSRAGVWCVGTYLAGRLKAMYDRVSWKGSIRQGVLQDLVARVFLPVGAAGDAAPRGPHPSACLPAPEYMHGTEHHTVVGMPGVACLGVRCLCVAGRCVVGGRQAAGGVASPDKSPTWCLSVVLGERGFLLVSPNRFWAWVEAAGQGWV